MDKCKKHAQYWEKSDVLTYMLENPVMCGRTCVCVCARVCVENNSPINTISSRNTTFVSAFSIPILYSVSFAFLTFCFQLLGNVA
jgi:hypothetical protein